VTIVEYITAVKQRLLTAQIVSSFKVARERVTLTDGHLRVRLTLLNGTLLEFSEYVQRIDDQIEVITYSYHWADADNNLIRRWDNTPHFPDLPGFPHHIHNGIINEVISGQPVSIFDVLDQIEQLLE
jgi:hypothetical protein